MRNHDCNTDEFQEMGILDELRLNECSNCKARPEPVFSPEPKVCSMCGWIMTNTTLAEFDKQNPLQPNRNDA